MENLIVVGCLQGLLLGIVIIASRKFDSKEKGLFYLKIPYGLYPFSSDVDACAGFCYKQMECTPPKGSCNKKHIFKALASNMRDIEAAGDHFMATKTGWFSFTAFKTILSRISTSLSLATRIVPLPVLFLVFLD